MSLLLSEADSFVGRQNLRVGKLLSLGGRTVYREDRHTREEEV